MKPFLKQVADHYYNKGNIESRCFVFPNRRSVAFFRKYLGEIVTGPVILPSMMTINDLFFSTSDSLAADRVTQLLELYESYKSLNTKAEQLDEFIFWGDVILGDFNDVDKYLVDPKQLFSNVADFKQIQDAYTYLSETQRKAIEGFVSHFNDRSGRLTVNLDTDNPDVKARFLMIWNILYRLYTDFNGRLRDKGLAYEGMVYRSLAESLDGQAGLDGFVSRFPEGTSFVFVGLNALNECEKKLLRKLRDSSLAEFCWDYSGRLISDPQNRSSLFMAENVVEFPQVALWDEEGLDMPQVNVVSIASSVGQAKCLPDILKSYSDDCAVVLPDETLLTSVLNSIPPHIQDINVTMGLPMSGSVLYGMMNLISSMQLHAVRRSGVWHFYHSQLWDLFSNEFFRKALDEESAEIVKRVKKESRCYIPQDHLMGTPLMDAVFRVAVTDSKARSASQIQAFADYQKNVLKALSPAVSDDVGMALELEYAKEYYRAVTLLQRTPLEVLPLTYVRLLSQILSSVSVPFSGEPLKGLQIMGPLEMRALDFRHLVIMSVNEGVFPRRSVSSSFVPPELRKGFGLPTYEYQDAVWAYYFYRAISRAEKVWLLVDSRTDGLKTGEESRYIKQLEYHFGVPLSRYVVRTADMRAAEVEDIMKTPEDVARIKGKSLSASTIQTYLACPAMFYYGTVKSLKAEDEVSESLDYGMFGTIYHDVMRAIYTCEEAMSEDFVFDGRGENERKLRNRLEHISSDYIRRWIDREDVIRRKVKALISAQLKTVEVTGRNLVVTDVIVKYVVKTLQRDLEQLKASGRDWFEILGREIFLDGDFEGQPVLGFVDRLDSFADGTVRVVDYKTGKVLKEDEDIHDSNAAYIAEKIFAEDVNDRPKIALQFFMYDYLLEHKGITEGKQVLNSVYSTAKLFKEVPRTVPLNRIFYKDVSERMKQMLAQMYSLDVPFRRTQDRKVCSYCDFKNICGR